ncbi:L,D-transpeptidase [Microbacterium sp. NPDC096154]|uniref:L,D-transpeptidase n=1 Tax=Microbacterium sp. NPDC096154 TaxID=3155549 RepID=UPI00331D58BE
MAGGVQGKKRRAAIGAVAVLLIGGGGAAAVFAANASQPSLEATPSATAAVPPPRTASPSPTPTVDGFPENDRRYDQGELPVVDVFSLHPDLPVDEARFAPTEGIVAQPREAGAPVFADPRGEPVAWLPHAQAYDGTVVPVIEKQDHWVRVLLVGRQALPGEGDPAQLTGWMRTADVALADNPHRVEVDISDRTVRIVTRDGKSETEQLVADDFGWGASATPTPLGRAFVMFVDVVESFAYTRGHPLVYLSVQSPTLPGFGGQPVAVTAFHYHDARSGPISNGCIRVSAEAIQALQQLPLGTPVFIRE